MPADQSSFIEGIITSQNHRQKQVSFKRSQRSSRNNSMNNSRLRSNDSSGELHTSIRARERNMRMNEQAQMQQAMQSLSPGKKSQRVSSLRKRSTSLGKNHPKKSLLAESRYSAYSSRSPGRLRKSSHSSQRKQQ